jgi:hypothetical protein
VRRRQPKGIRIVAALSVVASGLLAWLAPGSSSAAPLVAGIGVLALAAGESLSVTLPTMRGRVWHFGGVEVALAATLLHLPGASLWLAAVVAGLVLMVPRRHDKRSRRSLEYSVASFVGAAGVAALVFGLLRTVELDRPLAAGLAVVAAGAVRHALAAVAVGLTARRKVVPLIRRRMLSSAVYALGNGAIGLLAAELAARAPLGLAGLAVPALLLASGYEQQVRRTAQASLYAELARAQERAGTRSVDGSATIVLTVAARMLGGADIEMLLEGSDGLIRYAGDESGLRARTRVDPAALDAPWVLRLLASGGVRLSRESGRPECGACIGRTSTQAEPGTSPVAFLLARRPHGAPAFTRREAALVRALARQAEPWLTGAVESDGAGNDELSTETAAGLADVREAARRVLAGAAPQQFDADALIGELHALERAVAQLVGSTSAEHEHAAEPTADGALGLPAQRRSADWTTTGRLEDVEWSA